ncbi:hypothetical protein THARTR1_04284 [Trichoderma harzianum]|uniref:Uncharacterized protein n=1 Tax=Trichoderma harzianum TaxID=5544 RepID=A0A2K0UCE8_TRIHA|nr:hypothetical protein THARTR1_04284 [Trichoderma harzianum]
MGWWGKSSDSKPEQQQQQQQQEAPKEHVFDPKLPKAEKLPRGLQKIVDKADKDESFFDSVKEGR